ncbi:YVTN repeat-like/Quino protein amine dehydrogenase [Cercophora samala]|uniref:YVTN repeat-like/Quino protein amine dehydrogenase n=1 Tax=Cercophora samala TaxID=330535 RepID=A0AA39ZIW7_9PEZI|nr:YVTN repeat-like/Quino protein amine dehydrogenase [Cercophora samala]
MFKKHFSFRKKPIASEDDEDNAPHVPAPQTDEPSSSRLSKFGRVTTLGTNVIGHQSTLSSTAGVSPSSDVSIQDPLGLKVVYRPSGERRADIVFVHGLGGSSRMTWSKNRDIELFWPAKFLPLEPNLKDTRILTFGYNSNFRPGAGKNQMSILDFAKDLLFDLKYAQDEMAPEPGPLKIGEVPLIFVVHSMGGLVVKEAYMQGQNDPNYEAIIRAVSSIVFLSTPHRGSNLAEALNRILQVSFVSNPMKFISELAIGSHTLQKLNEQFRHIAPRLRVASFYETRPTPMLKKVQTMVLEKDSSMLGYPGEISKPLDADHHGVCKFASREDTHYIAVRNVLLGARGSTLVGLAKTVNPLLLPLRVSPRSETHLIRDFLAITEAQDTDYNTFLDRRTPGTCDWIFKTEPFINWMDDNLPKPRVLWVHGNAGTGKSILSSSVVNHLEQLGKPCYYFFVQFKDEKKRGLSLLLRSLASQLVSSNLEYADKIRELEVAGVDVKTAHFRNLWWWLFRETLFRMKLRRPLYLIIDGLDEADSPGALLKLLADLHVATIPIRVLIMSRKTHEISTAFQRLAKQVHLDSMRVDSNTSDILSYIEQELALGGSETHLEGSYQAEITAKLLERARGNFLWICLAVKIINDSHTILDVEQALEQLPAGMEALYDRMASLISTQSTASDRQLAHAVLGWTTCAIRPLSVEELGEALGGNTSLDLDQRIEDLCGGFVVIDTNGKVSLIHDTAREYLLRDGESRGSLRRPFAMQRHEINNKILQRCLQLLTDASLRSKLDNNHRLPPLVFYAIDAWFIHLSRGSSTDPDTVKIVLDFLLAPHVLVWIQLAAVKTGLRTLIVASRYLSDIVFKLRAAENESFAHAQAVDLLEGWATDLTKVVGKFGQRLVESPESIHKLIPPFCPEASVMYQQFGRKEARSLQVSGYTQDGWDDGVARFSTGPHGVASGILSAGNRIVILTNLKKDGRILIYDGVTFEETFGISQPERVLIIGTNKMGTLLVSYGYLSTRVWDLVTGSCIKVVKNPPRRPRPHTITFMDDDQTVLVGGEDRCVRSFPVKGDMASWELKAQVEEESVGQGTVASLPVCSAFSPNGKMIAYGYRSHPITIWELEPLRLYGTCSLALDGSDMTNHTSSYADVIALAWHPFNEEIFGLSRDGILFKLNSFEQETSAKVPQAGGSCLAVSQEGSLITTGDCLGTIKVFLSTDLSLVYQLSSQDPVTSICFDPDGRRIYDIRIASGNVWEPSALVRLAERSEYPDHNSDAMSEFAGSLAKVSLHAEHNFFRETTVLALSGQSVGTLYSYGTEDGVASLCEVGTGKVGTLEEFPRYISIEHLVWSEDGKYVALLDLSGRLSVKKVSRADRDRTQWEIGHEFDTIIPTHEGHVRQLLFHPDSQRLITALSTVLISLDLETQESEKAELHDGSDVKWLCHPTSPEYLLAFKAGSVRIFEWKTLQPIQAYGFSTSPRDDQPPATGLSRPAEMLRKLISSPGSPYVLLELTPPPPSKRDSRYLLLDVSVLQPDSDLATQQISAVVLPREVASRIREPLALLSRRRFVFLDVNRWICTWRLPRPGVISSRSSADIERFYFLPGDWAMEDELHLLRVMPDGTLLCPRNGGVVTVQCAKLRT